MEGLVGQQQMLVSKLEGIKTPAEPQEPQGEGLGGQEDKNEGVPGEVPENEPENGVGKETQKKDKGKQKAI
ncbi:hypothetical protein ID866_2695 [Astraeus odoratus]|nr:hypothetical protein ID866_2695 [Astraeus odoratus]